MEATKAAGGSGAPKRRSRAASSPCTTAPSCGIIGAVQRLRRTHRRSAEWKRRQNGYSTRQKGGGGGQAQSGLVIGILAHVDSGKTTLSEAMLYRAGACGNWAGWITGMPFGHRRLRAGPGITIFSKQAVLKLPGAQLTLLDTPGHVDFSAEAERPCR